MQKDQSMCVVSHRKEDSIDIFRLSKDDMKVDVCSLGASIIQWHCPSSTSKNKEDDIILGYKSIKQMKDSNNPYFMGVIVGRVANRIKNAMFHLNGTSYTLEQNNGTNCLHGGSNGFATKIWNGEEMKDGVRFTYVSEDGDEGFPGKVIVSATYTLFKQGSSYILRLDMNAKLDPRETLSSPINLTGHSYFNLAGHDSENGILDHELTMPNSYYYTPLDNTSIPTRHVTKLDDDTVMDFRNKRKLSDAIRDYANARYKDALEHLYDRDTNEQYGFDHNYILTNNNNTSNNSSLVTAAILSHPASGRRLTVRTNAPGLQLYTSNYLKNDMEYKEDACYKQWQGICLESQHFPDSINVEEDSCQFQTGRCFILKPGCGEYEHVVEYQLEL